MARRVRSGHRRTPAQAAADRRARLIVGRLGAALREARGAAGLTQRDVAVRAGVAQATVSFFERGERDGFSFTVASRLALAVGRELFAGLDLIPGAQPPRDIAHLGIQELVLRAAVTGPWRALPEARLDRDGLSIDVRLLHATGRLAVVIEIWTWFADVGAAVRGLDQKVEALALELDRSRDHAQPATVLGLWVVRATRRNRALVRDHAAFFKSRFPIGGGDWLRSLAGAAPAPNVPGMLWVDVAATRLWGARLG